VGIDILNFDENCVKIFNLMPNSKGGQSPSWKKCRSVCAWNRVYRTQR